MFVTSIFSFFPQCFLKAFSFTYFVGIKRRLSLLSGANLDKKMSSSEDPAERGLLHTLQKKEKNAVFYYKDHRRLNREAGKSIFLRIRKSTHLAIKMMLYGYLSPNVISHVTAFFWKRIKSHRALSKEMSFFKKKVHRYLFCPLCL